MRAFKHWSIQASEQKTYEHWNT